MNKRKIIIISVAAVIVLFIAINIWQQSSKKHPEVEVATLEEKDMQETVITPGTLTLEKEQYVYFEADKGEVDEILVEEGDAIDENEELLRYENKQLASEIEQNELQIRSASLELEKVRKEHEEIDKELEKDSDNELVQEEHDQIKLQHQLAVIDVEQAQMQKESLEEEQNDLVVYSDVDGTVLSIDEKASSAGEMSEQAVIRIGSLDEVVVEGEISEYDTLNIKKDQKVTLTSDAVPEEEWDGKVSFIGDLPEEDGDMSMEGEDVSALYPIQITLEEDIDLKPGFNMLIEVITDEEKVSSLPIEAVQQDDDMDYVFIAEDGKAKQVEVKTGLVDSENIEIKEGVTEGDKVITSNILDMSHGMEVTVK